MSAQLSLCCKATLSQHLPVGTAPVADNWVYFVFPFLTSSPLPLRPTPSLPLLLPRHQQPSCHGRQQLNLFAPPLVPLTVASCLLPIQSASLSTHPRRL